MTGPAFLWRIACRVPLFAVDAYEEFLRSRAGAVAAHAGVDDADWVVEGFAGAEPDRDGIVREAARIAGFLGIDVPAPRIELQPVGDWVADNLAAFPPVSWGRYHVHGSHVTEPVPPGRIGLRLDAGTAFGSGEHPTTGGCLLALDGLARRRRFCCPLDLGCGSGILSIAAAKTWRVPVLAADIDPEAVRVTTANARGNGVARLVRAVKADGFGHRAIAGRAPYDLILANILARPLSRLARPLARHLAPGGVAVISGIIERDGPWMIAVHRRVGLRLAARHAIDGWLTLVFRRPVARPPVDRASGPVIT